MEYPILIIMGFDPNCGEASCVQFNTEFKVTEESTEEIKKAQVSEILVIPDAAEKQHLYRCKQVGCGRAYSTEDELHLHEVNCCNETNFTCDICKETFKDKYMLRIHMYLHQEVSTRKKYSCPYDSCPRFYYVKRSFDAHIKSHEGKKLECTYPGCGKKLSRQAILKKHMLVHRKKELLRNKTMDSAVSEFTCYICKRNFETKINLERHMSDHQDVSEKIFAYCNYEEDLNNGTNGQEHVCPLNGSPCDICKKTLITTPNMQSHMSVDQKEDFFCGLCKRKLQTKEQLDGHMYLHKGKGFPCSICEKVFPRKSAVHRHMLVHTEEKVPCDICKKMVKKRKLKIHMFVHQQEDYFCDLCNRKFKTKEQLERHMYFHEGKGFPCSMCEKVFTRKDAVNRHMLLHTEEKVPCDVCKKMLSKGHLKTHMSFHFKKYPCNICNRIFASKGNMVRHVSLHNGETFCCEICQKRLKTKEQMQTHMSRHQIKTFTCDVCKEIFSTLQNMYRHMSLHTQEEFLGGVCKKLRTEEHTPHQRQVFTCVRCKVSFTSKTRMQEHVCLQTEMSPNVMCKQRLQEQAEVQRHITDQQKAPKNETFHCHIRKRCFKSESFTQKHISLAHESLEKEGYPCGICKRLFRTKRGVQKHMSFHKDPTEKKKFSCPYYNCSRGYLYRRNLNYHIRHSHGGKEFNGMCVDHSMELASKVGAALTATAEGCKQTEGVQTHGENTLSSSTITSQKYEHGRKWLLENKNTLHKSLKLKSEQYKGEKDKLWMNAKILIEPLYIPKNCPILRESLQSTKTQVRKLYDSYLYVNKNFVPSGKDYSEQDFELQEKVESSHTKHEEGVCSGADPIKFKMDVSDRIYLMKKIMEEMFPAIKSACL